MCVLPVCVCVSLDFPGLFLDYWQVLYARLFLDLVWWFWASFSEFSTYTFTHLPWPIWWYGDMVIWGEAASACGGREHTCRERTCRTWKMSFTCTLLRSECNECNCSNRQGLVGRSTKWLTKQGACQVDTYQVHTYQVHTRRGRYWFRYVTPSLMVVLTPLSFLF